MPKPRKTRRARERTTKYLIPPVIALVTAAATGTVACTSGLQANGAPLLVLMPLNGVLVAVSAVLAGMLLIRAGSGRAAWRTVWAAVALLVAAIALAISVVPLFDLGFRRYAGKRATEQELKAAAADLLGRQREGARATLSLRELPSDSPSLEPIHRLRPDSVKVDRGIGKQSSEVYLAWTSSAYDWGIAVTPKKVEYRRGE